MMRVEIDNAGGVKKDTECNAVLSADLRALKAYKRRRDEKKEVSRLSNDINTMKKDIQDIKDLIISSMSVTEKTE